MLRRSIPALRPAAMAALLALTAARGASAQCPDGTPPPCRGAAPMVVRRPAPPLDEHTWIVLPFENVARVAEVDWLRDASVNLLYLDMSRWRDIRVIDDERVADYMREVPEARGGGPLGLQTGIAVARRAGAGKLVMGDLLKVGSRTQVVAKVFDVRTGVRLRSVRQETASADSLMAIFGTLARGILNVEPPPGSGSITVGTTSLAAYQEYVAGVRALSGWDLDSAQQHFTRALALDTGFALAHYKLSVVFGWESPNVAEHRQHAEAASRFAAGLPPRERTLIAAQLAQARDLWGESCVQYASLVRADSSDVEAWYNLGECNYHDAVVVARGGDSSRLAFRGSWNTALRAFRRTLELDPTFHLAFAHIPDILQADQRFGCVPPAGQESCASATLAAVVIRQADTLVLRPVPITGPASLAAQFAEAVSTGTRHANYAEARSLAAEWVAAGPTEPRAHRALARALLRTGQLDSADRELRSAGSGGTRIDRLQLDEDRVELDLKLGRLAEAAATFDSMSSITDSMGAAQLKLSIAIGGVIFGRFARLDTVLGALVPSADARAFVGMAVRLLAGGPPGDAERIAAGYAGTAQRQGARAADVYGALAAWGVRWLRTWSQVPALDTAGADGRVALAATVLLGDPARIRRALAAFDAAVEETPVDAPENGMLLASAEAHLAVGDSAAALERMLDYERRWPYAQVYERLTSGLAFGCFLWPRSFLLLGDLAAAQRRPDVAARAYRRFIGMWQGGDAEVQPSVTRARQALATLPAAN